MYTHQQSFKMEGDLTSRLQTEVLAAVGRGITHVNEITKEMQRLGEEQGIEWLLIKPEGSKGKWFRKMILTVLKTHIPNYKGRGGDRCSKMYKAARNQMIQDAIKKSATLYKEQHMAPDVVVAKCKEEMRKHYSVTEPNDQIILDRYVECQVHEVLGVDCLRQQERREVERSFRSIAVTKRIQVSDGESQPVSKSSTTTSLTTLLVHSAQNSPAKAFDGALLLEVFKIEQAENTKQVITKLQIHGDLEKAKSVAESEARQAEATSNARQVEANAAARQAEASASKAQAEAEAVKAQAETQARIAEANAKVRIRELDLEIVRERPAREQGKRKRADNVEECARAPWCNQVSLSIAVWDARPPSTTDSIEQIFGRLKEWVAANHVPHRLRLPTEFPGLSMVYVKATVDINPWVQAFWTPPPAPSNSGSVAIDDVPTHRSVDLVDRLLSHWPANKQPPSQRRKELAEHLLANVVQPMVHNGWACLFQLPTLKTKIQSHIDWERDPVVPLLKDWVSGGGVGPAPAYPCPPDMDSRPPEEIPHDLRDISGMDVLPALEAAGLGAFCARHRSAYAAALATQPDVTAAHAPRHAEMVRQWRRIVATSPPQPTFRDVSVALGWNASPNDGSIVKFLVQAMLHPTPLAEWYDTTVSPVRWNVGACLWPMRVAAVYVARLHRGGANLQYAAKDLEAIIPTLKT